MMNGDRTNSKLYLIDLVSVWQRQVLKAERSAKHYHVLYCTWRCHISQTDRNWKLIHFAAKLTKYVYFFSLLV